MKNATGSFGFFTGAWALAMLLLAPPFLYAASPKPPAAAKPAASTPAAKPGDADVKVLKADPARELFEEEYECVKCHTVNALGMARSKEFYKELKERTGLDPKDLSGVGLERDTDYVLKWIPRKLEKDGQTHKGEFEGTPKELKEIARWLMRLRFEPAAAPSPAPAAKKK